VDEQGKPLVVYHGTSKAFTKFDWKKSAMGVFWFSSNKKKIEKGESGAASSKEIMPVYLSAKKLAGWDEYDKLTLGQLRDQGYDGIKLDDDYVVFEPNQIKSATKNSGAYSPKSKSIHRSFRAYCPTGEGGGVDNSCGGSSSPSPEPVPKSSLPKAFPAGSEKFRDAVDAVSPNPEAVWDRSKGLAETPPAKVLGEAADEQTSQAGKPLTPEAEKSYTALVDEIGRQYESLTDAGLKVRAWRGQGEPYGDPPGSTKPNSDKMREEVAKTGEFSFFMTEKGFGSGDATPNHPMLRETKYKTADGEPMIANDLFRVVHDMVAHVRGGYSFSTNGEYNGMLTHASTLPESAWPALFAETFGQNAVYEKTGNYAQQNAYASTVGPQVIRSELAKRNRKSSRSAVGKRDSDEPLGYQHIKSRPWLLAEIEKRSSRSVSTDARVAGLMAFAQARNCGTGPGGFQTGNTCAAGKLQDAAEGAAKGAVKGAAIGLGTTWTPVGAAKGAAVGAAVGAVKGLYDNAMRPTRVMKTIEKIGTSKEKVESLVKRLGGSPKSSANTIKGKLTLKVRDKDGKRIFDVTMTAKKLIVAPARESGRLSKSEIASVKTIAKEQAPREIDVIVKEKSPGYVSTLVKAGFKVSADTAGTLVASFVAPFAFGVGGAMAEAAVKTAYGAVTKKRI
jgi:hypothetical protein